MFPNLRLLARSGIPRISLRYQHDRPQEGFAYQGNPHETKLRLKREIPNIGIPDFEKVESLKWSDWAMLKDIKRRHIHADYWQHRTNLKNLGKNSVLPSIVRDLAWEERMATPRASSKSQLRNRCALSSRSRGKFPRYRLSRIIFRDCADHGLLGGYIRAKWG